MAGCATPHAPVPLIEQRAVIEIPRLFPGNSVFDVPATAVFGQGIPVAYATFGSSSCSRHLAPEVTYGADFIRIAPRLQPLAPNTACTDDLATNRHSTVVSWTDARVSDLRVLLRGYRFDGTTLELERRIRLQ